MCQQCYDLVKKHHIFSFPIVSFLHLPPSIISPPPSPSLLLSLVCFHSSVILKCRCYVPLSQVCYLFFFIILIKCLTQSKEGRKEEFWLSLRVGSIMIGKSWCQELEEVNHVISTVGKHVEMKCDMQFASSLTFSLLPVEWWNP